MLGLLSAEGAGFDLSSFKVVILEGSIAEGGEANVLAGERVFGESKCSFAFFFPPSSFPSKLSTSEQTASFLFKWL